MNPIEELKVYVSELETRMEELQVESAELDAKLLKMNPPKPKLDFSQLKFREHPLTQDVRVWKDECAMSFATPYSPNSGLFLNLLTLSSYSLPYVKRDWELHDCKALYLHQEWLWVATEPKEQDKETPKRLAIGVEDGFAKPEGTCEKLFSLRVGPNFMEPYPIDSEDVPAGLKRLVQEVINRDDASRQVDVMAWEASMDLKESRFARTLPQVENPPQISSNPANWKCEESGIRENLWLNLSDGYIGSGRANWDGTGGTGAALRHFHETGGKYPLAVKLGTISKDGTQADVYSYAEDDMVIDPFLTQHLAHFGIQTGSLNKTDKTLSEMEVDLNSTYDWSRISQEGEQLEKVSGSHCVGLENLGNSCYCNSVYQMLFGTQQFTREIAKLHDGEKLTTQPERNLAVQLVKLSNAMEDPMLHVRPLLAPHQEVQGQDYVVPKMLKHLLGENHRDFSGREQQDAAEYVLHMLERIRRLPQGAGERVYDLFKFSYEQRSVCMQSNKVKYDTLNNQLMLSLNVNRDEDSSLWDCLNMTLQASEHVDDFVSPETGVKGVLERTIKLQTFPKLLLVQLKRFVLKDDMSWEAVKLDHKITLPTEVNLDQFESKGLQPGEEVMRAASSAAAQAVFVPNEQVVGNILELGFSRNGAVRAAKATNNDAEQAMQWVMEHMEDADFNSPLPQEERQTVVAEVSADAVEMLGAMGFDSTVAEYALKQCNNDVERAADFLFNRSPEELAVEMLPNDAPAAAPAENTAASPTASKRYYLRAVVSHIGKSTSSGHYVCHYNQSPQGQPARWVFFNDDKIVLANSPPLDLGYLLLYEQI